jgi:ADP-heptose:LPS heptosyltransferase
MDRVLVANIFGIGDVLFTQPLISNLKKGIPGVRVEYLCNERARPVVEMMPEVDDVLVYEKDSYIELWKRSRIQCLKRVREFYNDVKRRDHDAVFDFMLSREFGLFSVLAGIPRRIGMDYKGRGLFLTDKMPIDGFRGRHVAEHYLDLLGFLGLEPEDGEMRVIPPREDKRRIRSLLEEKGYDGGPLVVVAPGGGASWGEQARRKRWDPIGFTRAADILLQNGVRVVLCGDRSERELCRGVEKGMDGSPLAVINDLDLGEYAALLASCDQVLCNDGGALHLAVAAGTGTVSIFGPVDDIVYGPFPRSDKHRVITADKAPCRPCYDRFRLPECGFEGRCLLDIAPEKVAEVCLEQLKSN